MRIGLHFKWFLASVEATKPQGVLLERLLGSEWEGICLICMFTARSLAVTMIAFVLSQCFSLRR